MLAMHTLLEKIGGRPRADRCTQTNRYTETHNTHLVREPKGSKRRWHNTKAHTQQDAESRNNNGTQVPTSTLTAPMNRNHDYTPTPHAPPHQTYSDTATHTKSTQASSPTQQEAVEVKAARDRPHPVPPSQLEDHPPHHSPTTRTKDPEREVLTNREHKNEGQQPYGTTFNQ